MVVQVLITAAQNAVPYRDLGVATSGVTFFRSIGGSFGVALFGSMYSARLEHNINEIIRRGVVPPGFDAQATTRNAGLIRALPGPLQAQFLDAYAEAIRTVVLLLAPVSLAAALLALLVREVPLRGLARAAAPDLGASAGGTPSYRSSRHEVEGRLSRLMLRDSSAQEMYARLGAVAGVHLPAASMWALSRIALDEVVPRTELARRAGVPIERGRPYVDGLVRAGYVVREDGNLRITKSGRDVAERLFRARREGLAEQVEGRSPQEHPELAALLTELSRESLDVPPGAREPVGGQAR
jgi:hypothetical protein